MAQNLALFPQAVPYIGTPYASPIGLCTPPAMAPKSVRIDIDWSLYNAGPNNQRVAVIVNLLAQGSVQVGLDQIRSVYIDNTFSLVPIYIQFPDTLFTIVCPPGAVVMSPVFSNVQQCRIFGEGFAIGSVPYTSIHFSNVDRQGYFIPSDLGGNFETPVLLEWWQSGQLGGGGEDAPFAFTVNDIPIGVATADRIVLVTMSARSGAVIPNYSSVTFDAVPVPVASTAAGNFGNPANRSSIYWKLFPALTVFDLVANASAGNNLTWDYAVYTIKNLTDVTAPLDVDQLSGLNTAPGLMSRTLDMLPNSVMIAVANLTPPSQWIGASQDTPAVNGFGSASYFSLQQEAHPVSANACNSLCAIAFA